MTAKSIYDDSVWPDELAVAEAVLRHYPDALREARERENYLLSLYGSSCSIPDVRVSGGAKLPAQERYAEAVMGDERLKRARRVTKAVERNVGRLNKNEKRVLRLVYFEGVPPSLAGERLSLSLSYVRVLMEAVRTKMARACVGVYPDVCAMRLAQRDDRLDALRSSEDG